MPKSSNHEQDFRTLAEISEQDKQALEAHLVAYLQAREQVRSLEEEMKAERERILNLMSSLGLEKTRYEAYTVAIRTQERRTLDREKLLELGVSSEIIRRAENVTQTVILDVREARKPPAKVM
jgi:predicted  nucleic acid-binding Zn-ribbon protein